MSEHSASPLLLLTIRPAGDVDRDRLDAGLRQLTAEDPALSAFSNPATGTVVIGATGELQLEIVLDRLKREFNVEAAVGRPEIAYQVMSRELESGEGDLEPVIFEPVMRVDVIVPGEYSADVLRGLAVRGARIERRDVDGDRQIIWSLVRLSQMFGYSSELRQGTRGRGTYAMQFHSYRPIRDAGLDDDRGAAVTAPLEPGPAPRRSSVALPEPDDDAAQV